MFTVCSFDGKWCFLIWFSSYHCTANDIMILNHIIGTVMIGCEKIIGRRSPVATKCHSLLQLEMAICNLQPFCWLKMFKDVQQTRLGIGDRGELPDSENTLPPIPYRGLELREK